MVVVGFGVAVFSGACSVPHGVPLTRSEVAQDYSGSRASALGGQTLTSVDDLGLVSPWVREIEPGGPPVRHQANDDLARLGGNRSGHPRSRAPEVTVPAAAVRQVEGHPGYVWSPFAGPDKPVDVRKFAPGSEALCPYTLKRFIVPARVSPPAPKPVPTAVPEDVIEPPSLVSAGKTGLPEVELTRPDGTVEFGDAELPVGTWVEDKPGFVYSPYARNFELVDVEGREPGEVVKCPYSGKFFTVPTRVSEQDLSPDNDAVEGGEPEANES